MNDGISERFDAALRSKDPAEALSLLAHSLKAEGMTQQDMYTLFDQYRADHHGDTDERLYDAILDVMDCIVGWCGPNSRLFESDLKT